MQASSIHRFVMHSFWLFLHVWYEYLIIIECSYGRQHFCLALYSCFLRQLFLRFLLMNKSKITLYWPEGSGKSTTAKLLASMLWYELQSSGSMMRACAQDHGMDIYEFGEYIKDHPGVDHEIDQRIVAYGENTDGFVFESRLAWHWIPDSFKIVLTWDEGVFMERIASREGLSVEEATHKTTSRNNANTERYAALYPHIPFPPQEHIFDLAIDTTLIAPDEVVSKILAHLDHQLW